MSKTAVTTVPIHPNYSSAASPNLPDGVVCLDGIHGGRADYVAIATAALNRGFRVTPVHPLEKRGVLYNWNRQPTTTLSEVLQHAKDFPYHNVGWGALSSLERSAESFGHGIERLTNETHDRLAR